MSTEKVKCLIIGSGPAGYTAAFYTGDVYKRQFKYSPSGW